MGSPVSACVKLKITCGEKANNEMTGFFNQISDKNNSRNNY